MLDRGSWTREGQPNAPPRGIDRQGSSREVGHVRGLGEVLQVLAIGDELVRVEVVIQAEVLEVEWIGEGLHELQRWVVSDHESMLSACSGRRWREEWPTSSSSSNLVAPP